MNEIETTEAKEVEIKPAATVMLLDDRPDLQVLMVKRTARAAFAADMWVFPGGRVESTDYEANLDEIFEGLSDDEASRRLEVSSGGLAWWLAACRETLEEVGLLLTTAAEVVENLERWKRAVREDGSSFVGILQEAKILLDAASLEDVARFITPLGAPRRFDARFFVGRYPVGQQPHQDHGEIVDWRWVQPSTALREWQEGHFELMPPTSRMLACLARYTSTESALVAARNRLPPKRVRVVDPKGEYKVVLPGERGYETAETEIETGWVRLWDA
jgi:8-oxo-dGTP pyrophosphatase MutT (NUDIX family)